MLGEVGRRAHATRRGYVRSLAWLLPLGLALACGSEGRKSFEEDVSGNQPGAGSSGGFGAEQGCGAGGKMCVGNDVHQCTDKGEAGAFVKTCDATGDFCVAGECKSGCDAAEQQASNVGCEFWAVDLDNEYSSFNDAAGAPWGVVVSNFGAAPAQVIVERNDAPLGAPPVVGHVVTRTIAPGQLAEIELPTREVDGSTQADNGPGTFVSPNGYRIRSSVPVVVYQFNTLRHTFSNDASLLVPKNGLGLVHRVVGWPTANPISGGFAVAGIPDHSFVTILGTEPNTKIKIVAGGPMVAGGPIPALPKGGVFEGTIGPFDVINLESTGIPGDLSGTIVEASLPVAVFTGGERGIAPIGKGVPTPPSYVEGDGHCCTDHLEEQVLPVSSYGRDFVVTRSPVRSRGWVEPDLLRFMGVAAPTEVKTSMPPPFDRFTLQPGEVKDTWTTTDIVVEATEPLVIAQILVSQGFTEKAEWGGDPSLTIFPPVDQYRRDYLFQVPPSWQANFVVISAEVGADVKIDGKAPTDCVVAPAGSVKGKTWEARRCRIGEGAHKMVGDKPFGIVAYGYGSRGSYAFIGGANVRRIYVAPPLK